MATVEEVHINTRVANKRDAKQVGLLKRVKKGVGYVMVDGAKEPIKIPLGDLITIKQGRTAKAAAKEETGDTPAMPTHTTSSKQLTSKIQIRITGTIRGPNWKSIQRSFDEVDSSKKYLNEFQLVDINGRDAKIKEPAEADVHTNYNIDSILKGIAPKAPMPVIIHYEPQQRALVIPKPTPESSPASSEDRGAVVKRSGSTRSSAKSNSDLVPLKQICREINLDPREARMKLRSGVKSKKIPHEPQGRWEWAKDEVDDIKAFLQGAETKEKKTKPPKPTKAAEKIEKKAAEEAKAAATKVKPSKKKEAKQEQVKKEAKKLIDKAEKTAATRTAKVKAKAKAKKGGK